MSSGAWPSPKRRAGSVADGGEGEDDEPIWPGKLERLGFSYADQDELNRLRERDQKRDDYLLWLHSRLDELTDSVSHALHPDTQEEKPWTP